MLKITRSLYRSASRLDHTAFSCFSSVGTFISPSLIISGPTNYKNILFEQKDKVGLITLNRPKALNALCQELFTELNDLLAKVDNDASIGAIVLTGSEKAFAAGADIKEMMDLTYPDTYSRQWLQNWDYITTVK
jgi:enoyl-CoA hydratase/carnithine racemase